MDEAGAAADRPAHVTGSDAPLRVLVAIAYYGVANEPFVRRLIDEYRSMSYDIDIVVLSEAPKDLPGVEIRVGLPIDDPYSLPFAYKPLFLERRYDYDLFIYTEDDTLITERSIESFLWATDILPDTTIAGFLRTEEAADGTLRCSSVNSRFHWRSDSAFSVGGDVFAEYTNPHGAAFILTQRQLDVATASGGFDLPPRSGRLDMRVTAATDPYTVCGLTKTICVTRLDDFLLPHLTNRYSDSDIGIDLDEFREQADAVGSTLVGSVSSDRLFDPTTKLDDPRWDANFLPPVDRTALAAVPSDAESVLVFGTTSGTTEAALLERGVDVVAIPVDEIIATSARRRGVRTLAPDLRRSIDSVADAAFDGLLLSHTLHHVADPAMTLRELRTVLRPGGTVIATLPNVRRERARWLARRAPRPQGHVGFAEAGVHLPGPRTAVDWFRRAGLRDIHVSFAPDGHRYPLLGSFVARTLCITGTVPDLASARIREASERPRPRVSIGVPVFNGENFLEHALQSIADQDLTDIEVLILDNASDDRTPEICERFVAADERFRYIRQPTNLGAARNYNDCFRHTRGEFFTWLAHDDVRAPTFLERCVAEFDAATGSPVLVYPQAEFIDEQGVARAHDTYGVDTRSTRPHERLAVAVSDTGAVNPIFGVIRSSALEQTRLIGPFVASDRVLLAELAVLGELHEVPETLSFRRLHSRMSTNANPGKAERTRWFDPDAAVPRLNEVSLLALEHVRSVLRLPLSLPARLACVVTIPACMSMRRGRIMLGRWRRRLTASRPTR